MTNTDKSLDIIEVVTINIIIATAIITEKGSAGWYIQPHLQTQSQPQFNNVNR